jgi:hypothetical protein
VELTGAQCPVMKVLVLDTLILGHEPLVMELEQP